MRRAAFTLVEIIVAVMVIAIIMYAGIAIFITSGVKGVNVEVYTIAQTLAEDKLEEFLGRSFDLVSAEAETDFSSDLAEYSYEIIVAYVSSEALDQPVGGPTDYKRVRILIRHPQLANPTSLEVIKANY
jgi:prepilin-type N-terminal cleavage/methylation domain-containing protein